MTEELIDYQAEVIKKLMHEVHWFCLHEDLELTPSQRLDFERMKEALDQAIVTKQNFAEKKEPLLKRKRRFVQKAAICKCIF